MFVSQGSFAKMIKLVLDRAKYVVRKGPNGGYQPAWSPILGGFFLRTVYTPDCLVKG